MMDAIEFVKQLRRMIEQGVPRNRFIYPCVGKETDSPEEVSAAYREKDGSCAILHSSSCTECREAFWLAEVEE